MEAKLTLNKIEISLGYEDIKLITDIIEDHQDGQEVFHELAQCFIRYSQYSSYE